MGAQSSVPEPSEIPIADREHVLRGETPSVGAFCARLKESKNLVVLAGAGISVAAGIPDFRSTADSVFSRGDLAAKYGLERPEDIFDIDRFRTQPEPFFELSAELMAGAERRPTVFHVLLRLLQDKGVLRRVYTQNIDTLERAAGLRPDVLIEAHGSYATSTCLTCGAAYDQAWLRAKLAGGNGSTHKGGVAATPPKTAAGTATARAGSPAAPAPRASPGKPGTPPSTVTAGSTTAKVLSERAVIVPRCDAAGCSGVVKPDITFYGESLPAAYSSNVRPDTEAADALIVAGSSLKVMPVARLPDKVGHLVPRLLINREAVSEASGPTKPQPAKVAASTTSTGAAAPGGSPISGSPGGSGSSASSAAAADPAASAACDPAESSSDAAGPRDEEWAAAVDFIFKGSNTGFRFGLEDNYRDIFLRGDADAGALAVAAGCGWLADLRRLHQEINGCDIPEAVLKTQKAAVDATLQASAKPAAARLPALRLYWLGLPR